VSTERLDEELEHLLDGRGREWGFTALMILPRSDGWRRHSWRVKR
jgi:hypothetical protein